MLLFAVFTICMSFLMFVRETALFVNYDDHYPTEELRGLASFLSSHDKTSSIDIETDIGISKTFFNSNLKIDELPSTDYLPFDSALFFYSNILNISANDIPASFLKKNFFITINNTPISSYDLKHYSNSLILQPFFPKKATIWYLPNPRSIVEYYMI